MTPHQRHLFLQKFANGQHTPAEHQAFLRWLRQASGKELEQALAHYQELQGPSSSLPPAPELITKLEARLDSASAAEAPLPVVRAMWPRLRPALAAVVALLILAGGSYLVRQTRIPALVYLHKTVPAGQTDSVTLADGSTVVLNERTTLTYPARFASAQRDVYLRGEAYFRVTKNPARPFVIHSGPLRTRVVGTSFNVYAYPEARRQEVTVLTGKVVVAATTQQRSVTLLPAQRAVFERAGHRLTSDAVPNPRLSLAWRRGQLQFEDAPLEEVLDKLSTRYGVRIRARTPRLHQCRLTVRFQSESVAEVLQVLRALTHSRSQTDTQRTIWLESQGT